MKAKYFAISLNQIVLMCKADPGFAFVLDCNPLPDDATVFRVSGDTGDDALFLFLTSESFPDAPITDIPYIGADPSFKRMPLPAPG